jgi:hypothetical protein
MKTIFFYILMVGNLATAFGKNLSNGFTIQSASLKQFGLQGDFVSKERCENVFFDLEGREQLPDLSINKSKEFVLKPLHLSGLELSSWHLNLKISLGAVKAKDFNPSLVQYTIHKPLQNVGRDMKSFNDGRYTTFGNAYLVYGLARDLGFLH